MKYFFIVNFILCAVIESSIAFAGNVSGTVSNEGGKPLSYATVYVQGTTLGTTCNEKGSYSINVPSGAAKIIFQSIGYKTKTIDLQIGEASLHLDVKLEEQQYALPSVTVNAGEDPAYAIIRHTIKNKDQYAAMIHSYSCDAYIKDVQVLDAKPKFMGKSVTVDVGGSQSKDTGILYLSESVSKIYYRRPDHFKEIQTASKVSGSDTSFSINRNDILESDFYNNRIPADFTPRECISPIADDALFYYRYILYGTFSENGRIIDKIKVIPKRKYEPCYAGFIYIVDSIYRIHSLDLYLTKTSQLLYLDTFSLKQIYVPVNDSVWMYVNKQIAYRFDLFGFKAHGFFNASYSNYELNIALPDSIFNHEVFRINEGANHRDSTYWTVVRPMPLTNDELENYHFKDSVARKRSAPAYKDSIVRAQNKWKPEDLVFGYHHQNLSGNIQWQLPSLATAISFNTVEGWTLQLKPTLTQKIDHKLITYQAALRYGFSAQLFSWSAGVTYSNIFANHLIVSVEGGSMVKQFDASEPISPFVNSLYTLFLEKNYMKLYQAKYFHVAASQELFNGFTLQAGVNYANRNSLHNTTDFTFIDHSTTYSENIFVSDSADKLFAVSLGARILFDEKYQTTPNGKENMGSKFPELSIRFEKAFPDFFNSERNYLRGTVALNQTVSLGLPGMLSYSLSGGAFLQKKSVTFYDDHHFHGNQTIFINSYDQTFQLLDYYAHSTDQPYAELHLNQHFNGWLTNKIPGFRTLNIYLTGAFNALYIDSENQYYEFGIGLEKIPFVSLEWYAGFYTHEHWQNGIRIDLQFLR